MTLKPLRKLGRCAGIPLVLACTAALSTGCQEGSPGSDRETACADGVDNDQDGDTDCVDTDCAEAPECRRSFDLTLFSEDLQQRGLDVLLVLDTSGSTSDTREQARVGLSHVLARLRLRDQGVPDLHIGVTSTDLAAAGQPITYCEEPGDDGNLLTPSPGGFPIGAPYIIDRSPEGCSVTRDDAGDCTGHDCTQASCPSTPPLSLDEDSRGCPRCRNTGGESLYWAIEILGQLDNLGCGFEQPLEAMYLALDANPNNAGFLRDGAHLLVIIAVDEDDCSASDPYFFDRSDTSLDSPLGPLTSYRCFEWGVTCDIDDRTHVGLRENCRPRDDPDALLHPIHRYTDLLRSLKRDEDRTVAVLAGPVEDDAVRVTSDELGCPELGSAFPCGEPTPAVRLKAFAQELNAPEDWWWALTPECLMDISAYYEAAGEHVAHALGDDCAPYPPLGCADAAAAHGLPGDGHPCNDECLPSCVVTDLFNRATPQEYEVDVPHCLEVCPTGSCPGNTARETAYQQGRPAPIDASLPVPACWQVGYDARCVDAKGARVVISRQETAPPLTMTYVSCDAVAATELHCTDGRDGDGDCLVDAQDPDCGG